MSENIPQTPQASPRDAAHWAQRVDTLKVGTVPDGARNINVEGRRVVGALQGFGQLWQKTYRIRLPGVEATPAEVVRMWKEHFPEFWPSGNHFYPSLSGVTPGEVALLELSMPGGMPLNTGMLVIYADDEAFTLMTPQGHMESGWITFSAFEADGCTVAQVQSIARANDPIYEIGFLLFAHRRQERFWHDTLHALAAHYGVVAPVTMEKQCVDRRWQWRETGNIWQNAAIRTTMYLLATPVRRLRQAARRAR
jgi:hypothetical protein